MRRLTFKMPMKRSQCLAHGGGSLAVLAAVRLVNDDVPHPAARRLHHLVGHAAVVREEAPAEHHRGVIHGLRHLVAPQFAVTPMRQEWAVG